MTSFIHGLWAAMPTPIETQGAVDHPALVRHARWLLEQGCDGIVPFGTTGEGTSFSGAERLGATEALLAAGIAPARIGLGAGCPAIPDSVALAKAALAIGLTHVLLLPPYFYRDAPPQGIQDAFAAILDGVADERLRATLYHIPQVSGVPVPVEAVASLRHRYGRVVAGVKDSSGDYAQFLAFRAAAPDVAIVVGHEADIARALADGGSGSICGMVNLAPDLVRAMFGAAAPTEAMAKAIALMQAPGVPVMKAVLAAQTGVAAWRRVRAPLCPADRAVGEAIAAALRDLTVPKTA